MIRDRLGIYIHWPFCLSKCPYCDFFSQVKKDVPQSVIVQDYLEDLEFYRSLNDNYNVDSIFFGGGTPSLIEPKYIAQIIGKVKELWSCADNIEISLEANPNSNHSNLFEDLKLAGINRLSLGIQALNDNDLKFLGRSHNLQQAYGAIDSVLQNFDNHSIDLIYARPNQEMLEWKNELLQATSLGFKHLSLYQLTIEDGTSFAKSGVKEMEDEKAREMYQLSGNILSEKGYGQYEISNYAQKGFSCRHNLGYWHGNDYVGVGKGAIGCIRSKDNILMTSHRKAMEEVSKKERAEELIIMGLRINEGINKQRFKSICGIDLVDFVNAKNLEQLKNSELIIEDDYSLYVTREGRMLLNYVIEQLCL